jgi:glycosyltransferase involved in cell wall biosynthesis
MKENSCQINYVYLSNKDYDGSVYETQIIDWLKLYEQHGCKFYLFQFLHVRNIFRLEDNKKLKKVLKYRYGFFEGFILQHPHTKYFYFLNAIILIFRLRKLLFSKNKTLLFGRVLIGNEVKIIKFFFNSKVEFIFDARAASAEEVKFVSIKNNISNKVINKEYYRVLKLEKDTIFNSKFTFSVSNKLIDYFITSFGIKKSKFLLYPCLSDNNKFFYDNNIRILYRSKLGFADDDIVLIYSGGFAALWHQSLNILCLFENLVRMNPKFKFIILTKDKFDAIHSLKSLNIDVKSFYVESVNNDLVVNYLNAADFGLLIREDTPMNMVSSPSKFSEYMLCGLPTLISPNVGDFSEFVQNNNCGIVIDDICGDYTKVADNLLTFTQNRESLSQTAVNLFSKQSYVDTVVDKFYKTF